MSGLLLAHPLCLQTSLQEGDFVNPLPRLMQRHSPEQRYLGRSLLLAVHEAENVFKPFCIENQLEESTLQE